MPPRLGPGLAVLLGHALLVMALWQAVEPSRQPKQDTPAEPPLLVWLRSSAAPAAAAATPAGRAPPIPSMPLAKPRLPARPVPAAGTTPPAAAPGPWAPRADTATTAPTAPITLTLPSAPAQAASRPPLDLRWRASPAQPPTAIDLVRGDAGLATPASRDDRLAQALGSDTTLREERRGDVRRFRRGRGCVDTRAPRDSAIDPFGTSTHPRPQLVEPC